MLLSRRGDIRALIPGDVFVHQYTGLRLLVEYNSTGCSVKKPRSEARSFLRLDGSPLLDSEGTQQYANGPSQLELVLRSVVSTYGEAPNSNYWAHWRVERDGMDVGTLHEIRAAWNSESTAETSESTSAAATFNPPGNGEAVEDKAVNSEDDAEAEDDVTPIQQRVFHPALLQRTTTHSTPAAREAFYETHRPRLTLSPGAIQNMHGLTTATMPAQASNSPAAAVTSSTQHRSEGGDPQVPHNSSTTTTTPPPTWTWPPS